MLRGFQSRYYPARTRGPFSDGSTLTEIRSAKTSGDEVEGGGVGMERTERVFVGVWALEGFELSARSCIMWRVGIRFGHAQ